MTREELHAQLPELKAGYKPSPDVLKQIGELTILMIVGPSGVGKSTMINRLGISYVPSDATRDKRPEEIEGKDYNFRTDYQNVFNEIKSGEFVQFVIGPAGDFYGTKNTSYPQTGMATLAVIADELNNFRQLGFAGTASAFITPPSHEEWMRRLAAHEMTAEQRQRRLTEASASLTMSLADSKMHFILNDDVEAATQQIQDLLEGDFDTGREERARQAAQECLRALRAGA